MEGKYFFLGALLPQLEFGIFPEMNYKELIPYLIENLSKEDLQKLQTLRRLFDLYHMRALWKGEEISARGNFDEKELEEVLLTKVGFPEYVYDFLDENESKEDRISKFSLLLTRFFNIEIEKSNGFLKKLLEFERDSRLVMTAFRAKLYGKDIIHELQYEDPEDGLAAEIIAQKDSPGFEPPEEYADLRSLFEEFKEDPLKLQQEFIAWKFNRIREMEGESPFSIDHILGYAARLFLIEKWNELDYEKGLNVVDNILKGAS